MNRTRREFMAGGITALVGVAAKDAEAAARSARRVGAVAYAFDYSIGLFGSYKARPGEKWDVFRFIDETRKANGDVAQIFWTMVDGLDDTGMKRLRAHAEDLDVRLELHGGVAFRKDFERTLHRARALGCRVVGCSFGMLVRPDKVATLDAWDRFTAEARSRLRVLAELAGTLEVIIGVENHLDFGVEELRDLIKQTGSPHVGVMFDVGNTVGTLDDPVEAADILGPLTVATHYKDFAIEETERGFLFTMVPLGCGSLRLGDITARLLKHVPPEVNFSIEMMNGQQFEVPWLEERFWVPFRNKPARELAATLRHIRGKGIDRAEFKPQAEVDRFSHEAHVRLEQERIARCIAHLRALLE